MLFFFSSRRRHTICALVTGVQTCALPIFGAATVEDLTWKQLLDTDACTICGRCTGVCPAHATGKPLDPREIVLKVGEVMAATGTPPVITAERRVGKECVSTCRSRWSTNH